MKWPCAVVAAAAVIGVIGGAKAEAAPSCTISAGSVAFGSYDVFASSANDSTGTVTITCNGAAHDIVVSLSTGASGAYNPRTMTRGGETLSYNLYRDAARTSIWGDGTGGTSTYTNANPANNMAINITVYGRVPANQDVSAGAYSDTVSAVINF